MISIINRLVIKNSFKSSIFSRNVVPNFDAKFIKWKSFKAAIVEEYNKPLTIQKIKNNNVLGSGMVKIDVHFCSLNNADVKYFTNEKYNLLLPAIPGTEFSGKILEIGENSTESFSIGENVVALLTHAKDTMGGLAEKCIISEKDCFQIGSVPMDEASILLSSYGSALLAFSKYCELKENDIVIITAGPAGNGLAAIQIAKNVFKAKVYAICDSDDTSSLVRDQGAHKTISLNEGLSKVYRFLESALKDKQAKVVYDAVGKGLFYVIADFVDPQNGHFLSVDPFFKRETFAGSKPEFKKSSKKSVKQKDESVKSNGEGDDTTDSTDWFLDKIQHINLDSLREENSELYRQIITETIQLCDEELINPYLSKTFGFYEINEAVEFIKSKKCTGKVLINVKQKHIDSSENDESDDEDDDDDKNKNKKKAVDKK